MPHSHGVPLKCVETQRTSPQGWPYRLNTCGAAEHCYDDMIGALVADGEGNPDGCPDKPHWNVRTRPRCPNKCRTREGRSATDEKSPTGRRKQRAGGFFFGYSPGPPTWP